MALFYFLSSFLILQAIDINFFFKRFAFPFSIKLCATQFSKAKYDEVMKEKVKTPESLNFPNKILKTWFDFLSTVASSIFCSYAIL
jgi:hypothetical protein